MSSTPLRERVRANLERLVDGRETEVGAALGSPDLLPSQRASNVRRYYRGSKPLFPSPETLDALAEALGVDVSELVREPGHGF